MQISPNKNEEKRKLFGSKELYHNFMEVTEDVELLVTIDEPFPMRILNISYPEWQKSSGLDVTFFDPQVFSDTETTASDPPRNYSKWTSLDINNMNRTIGLNTSYNSSYESSEEETSKGGNT